MGDQPLLPAASRASIYRAAAAGDAGAMHDLLADWAERNAQPAIAAYLATVTDT